jgi:hypothetical protein
MKQPVFIRLENTLAKAKEYNNGKQMEEYSFAGIQLLPNNEYPYIQRTYASEGIAISTFEVKVKSVDCNEVLGDITDYFSVVSSFNDSNTGLNQVYWKIEPEQPLDFGYTMVYLEILVAGNNYIYSSPFFYTEIQKEFVSRIDYRDNENLPMSSIDLVMYYKEPGDEMEVENYKKANGELRTNFVTITEYEFWQIGVVDVDLYRRIKYALTRRFAYVNLLRTFLKEGFDTPRMQALENFGEQEIQLTRLQDQVYDPNFVIPVPPPPPVDTPYIYLYVYPLTTESVNYLFTIENFSPEYLIAQYSLDPDDFSGGVSFYPVVSPETVYTGNINDNHYYFRLYYPPLNVYSNIAELEVKSLNITGVTRISPVEFSIEWNPVNYVPDASNALNFEFSNDGSKFGTGTYLAGNVSPKKITTYTMTPEPKYFRITDNINSIQSNIFELEEDGTT